MCIGFASESLHEHDQLISDGYDNIAHTDRTKVIDDVQAVPDAPNFYEVSNQINDPIDILRLQSFQLPCSCSKCREGTTCSFWSIRNSTTHNLKKKKLHAAKDDEFWKTQDMSKLTIDMLKAELLSRGLSTTHRAKAELLIRLKNYFHKK